MPLPVPRPAAVRSCLADDMVVGFAEAQRLLKYFPETGVFHWRVAARRDRKPGDVAGHIKPSGYRVIGIRGRRYCAHHLAWFMSYGRWPEGCIDHINHDPDDNRLANLREATKEQNQANSRRRKDNRSGLKGVNYDKRRDRWKAIITINRRQKWLGYHETAAAAHAAYMAAAKAHYGEFAYSGEGGHRYG